MNNLIITKFEQSALLINFGSIRLALDFGRYTMAESIAAIDGVDASIVSHKHSDHFSEPHLRGLRAPVYAPFDVVTLLPTELKTHTLRIGSPVAVRGVKVVPVHCDHGRKVTRPVQNLGFDIEANGRRLYFVGDAAVMTTPLIGAFDLVALPISGEGFVFGPADAVEFLRTIGHRGLVLPLHYHGPSEADCLDRFKEFAAGWCDVRALSVGESIEI